MAPSLSSTPPIIVNTLQATALSTLSNVLAQIIKGMRSGSGIHIDTAPLFNFALFTILNTPPNVLWQDFLESTFPSKTLQPKVRHVSRTARPSDKPAEIKAVREQWVETVQMEQRLDKRNTACKFVLDQTLGAFVNTVIFLAAMAALEGKGRHEILAAVAERTWPLMFAGYKVWPAVSLLQFTVVPPDLRIVVGCLVGVGWGIFLSLFTAA